MSAQDVQTMRLCDYTGIAVTTNSTVSATVNRSGAGLEIAIPALSGLSAVVATSLSLILAGIGMSM